MKAIIEKQKELIKVLKHNLKEFETPFDSEFQKIEKLQSELVVLETEDKNKQSCPTNEEIWEWASNFDEGVLSYLLDVGIHTIDELKHRIVGRSEGAKMMRDNKIPYNEKQ